MATKDLRVKFPQPCSEQWDAMRREGCNRFCDQCEKTIFDLENFTLAQTEALLRSGEEICVRAKLGEGGAIMLKPDPARATRRMVAAIGASVGLLALSSQPAMAKGRTDGTIAGNVLTNSWNTTVIATATDGKQYKAKAKRNGRYKIKHVPPGTYDIAYSADCEGDWKGGKVDVQADATATVSGVATPEDMCIIVGQLVIEKQHG